MKQYYDTYDEAVCRGVVEPLMQALQVETGLEVRKHYNVDAIAQDVLDICNLGWKVCVLPQYFWKVVSWEAYTEQYQTLALEQGYKVGLPRKSFNGWDLYHPRTKKLYGLNADVLAIGDEMVHWGYYHCKAVVVPEETGKTVYISYTRHDDYHVNVSALILDKTPHVDLPVWLGGKGEDPKLCEHLEVVR